MATEQEPQPALIEVDDMLEGMSPEDLLDLKAYTLTRVSDGESLVNRINNVLDGYGYSRSL